MFAHTGKVMVALNFVMALIGMSFLFSTLQSTGIVMMALAILGMIAFSVTSKIMFVTHIASMGFFFLLTFSSDGVAFRGLQRVTRVWGGGLDTQTQLAGKRVLVVGLGESGSDISLQAARVATATAISTRSGPG